MLRTVCKTVHDAVEEEDEENFAFTFSPIIPYLPKFTQGEHLLWVVRRLGSLDRLVRASPIPERSHAGTGRPWRHMGVQATLNRTMVLRHRELEQLVRTFWFNQDVRALRTAAIRLDSFGLLRRLSYEAPGGYCSQDEPGTVNRDGMNNFLFNCWVFIEESQMEVARWKPLRLDKAFPGGEYYFSKLQYYLHLFMEAVHHGEEKGFRGYFHQQEVSMKCLCVPRCPRR